MAIDAQDLGRAVKKLQYRNHRNLDEALRAVGTSLTQWDAMRAIAANPGVSSHALAELTFQTDQSFGTLAGRLIAKQHVARDQGVGRALVHRLTPEGARVLAKANEVASRVLTATFAPLSEDEQRHLLALLDRLTGKG